MNHNLENKVTVGFRCPPYLKNQLMQSAENQQVSLSEYVENLLLNLNSPQQEMITVVSDNSKMKELALLNSQLEMRLSLYETPLLRKLFEGLRYQNSTIKDMPDVVYALLNSYAAHK